jgi:TolB-like protein/Flp pilus assembly protein TadD
LETNSNVTSGDQEAINLVRELNRIELSDYQVIGGIVRYSQSARNSMKDIKQRIVASLTSHPFGCDNYLIWAPPGSGKSFFVQEIAKSLGDSIYYREINLAQTDETQFRSGLSEINQLDKPRLCFIDEVDSKPTEPWPYEALLPSLEPPAGRKTRRTCFIMAGSSGNSLAGMKENIAGRPKGTDLLSRIPPGNEFVIEPLELGDRLLVLSTQFQNVAIDTGRNIDEVEKMVFYYVASSPRLKSARQIRQLAVRCIERMPLGEERIKYDYLFDAGDVENKEFWISTGELRKLLVGRFVKLTPTEQVTVNLSTPMVKSSQPLVEAPSEDASREKNRIAVLPFRNISPDPKDDYFAEGMTEELISTLSKIRELKVISRTSVMRFKQSEKSLVEIAGELRVGAVLEGSVRKIGEDLRITAQLIDVGRDEHLWSEDYDRKFENIFALQKEIAQKVAASLKISILASVSKELGKRSTRDLEAYTLYLKGRNFRHKFTLDSFNNTIEYCERAIQKDSNFAQAYAEIAMSCAMIGYWDLLPSSEVFPKAERYAENAMKLDGSIPESHLALGLTSLSYRWDFGSAETQFKQAIELNPSSVDAHLLLALLLSHSVRRFDEAAEESKRALDLDPLSPWTCLWAGSALFISRHYEEAIEPLKNAIELDPTSTLAHDNLGCLYVELGKLDLGISEIRKAVELGGSSVAISDLAQAYARAGKVDEAKAVLAELLSLQEKDGRAEVFIAGAYMGLGDYDSAMYWLDRAYSNRSGYLLAINSDPFYEKIRPDSRFRALLRKIGFSD